MSATPSADHAPLLLQDEDLGTSQAGDHAQPTANWSNDYAFFSSLISLSLLIALMRYEVFSVTLLNGGLLSVRLWSFTDKFYQFSDVLETCSVDLLSGTTRSCPTLASQIALLRAAQGISCALVTVRLIISVRATIEPKTIRWRWCEQAFSPTASLTVLLAVLVVSCVGSSLARTMSSIACPAWRSKHADSQYFGSAGYVSWFFLCVAVMALVDIVVFQLIQPFLFRRRDESLKIVECSTHFKPSVAVQLLRAVLDFWVGTENDERAQLLSVNKHTEPVGLSAGASGVGSHLTSPSRLTRAVLLIIQTAIIGCSVFGNVTEDFQVSTCPGFTTTQLDPAGGDSRLLLGVWKTSSCQYNVDAWDELNGLQATANTCRMCADAEGDDAGGVLSHFLPKIVMLLLLSVELFTFGAILFCAQIVKSHQLNKCFCAQLVFASTTLFVMWIQSVLTESGRVKWHPMPLSFLLLEQKLCSTTTLTGCWMLCSTLTCCVLSLLTLNSQLVKLPIIKAVEHACLRIRTWKLRSTDEA